MNDLKIHSDPRVDAHFERYPPVVQTRLLKLRTLIIDTARELEGIEELQETLKWGEPSYLVKHGSTIRIDWKQATPDRYAMYFKCTSKLVPTFRKIFDESFTFERDRAIVFAMSDAVPEAMLKQCIAAALRYHRVKHLPNLGLQQASLSIQTPQAPVTTHP